MYIITGELRYPAVQVTVALTEIWLHGICGMLPASVAVGNLILVIVTDVATAG